MVYILLIVFILSITLTWGVRHYALARNIIDVPNHRSSHVVPTPRGGGVAFIVALLGSLPFIAQVGFIVLPVSMAFVGAGLLVAALGFLDDHGHISARFRLVGHFVAGLFALYCLGGMPALHVLGWILSAGWLLNILAVIYLVWLLNLYNFMDGIDGLAAVEALTVCLSGALLYALKGDYAFMGLPLALAAAVAGFSWWNLPPARIFMGDVGSGFLGLTLGILSIEAATVNSSLYWAWLILLGVFIVDATVTLLVRLCQGLRVYEAHRSHAYQHAARRFGGHAWVTGAVFIINVVWLLPMAILVACGYAEGFTALLIAYLPLLLLSIGFKAGRCDGPLI